VLRIIKVLHGVSKVCAYFKQATN